MAALSLILLALALAAEATMVTAPDAAALEAALEANEGVETYGGAPVTALQ